MELTVYIDRLKDGQEEIFEGTIPTSFLGEDPKFQETLTFTGKAYVTGDHLILNFEASTGAWLPCSICNELVLVPLTLTNFYHAESTKEIPSVFDFSGLLRDDLLLQLPQFTECMGKCPERETVEKFFKQPCKSAQFPFSSL
jgi:uncharacterized metal-binding protein YceD (DUF177 family)